MLIDPDQLIDRFRALPAAAPLRGRLSSVSGDVYLVGGAVRDLMLGRVPAELDLLVETDLDSLALALDGERHEFERFGTAAVRLDGFVYDLARTRSERYERPGALPLVTPADLATDLYRRDFTVNAIALGIHGEREGALSAVGDALEDLAAGRLRVMHDSSFVDDPTRLLRLARYASRLGFAIEPATHALARAAIASGAPANVSGNRLGAELRLAAAEADPVSALNALTSLGLDAAIGPGFGLVESEATRRALALLPVDGDRGAVVIAAAALAMEATDREQMLATLAFPASARDTILATARDAGRLEHALAMARTPSGLAASVAGAPVEAVALAGGLAAVRGRDGEGAALRWLNELRQIGLEIDGRDLLVAGVPAGPAVGAGLRAALAAKLDGRAEGRDAELAEALRAALA